MKISNPVDFLTDNGQCNTFLYKHIYLFEHNVKCLMQYGYNRCLINYINSVGASLNKCIDTALSTKISLELLDFSSLINEVGCDFDNLILNGVDSKDNGIDLAMEVTKGVVGTLANIAFIPDFCFVFSKDRQIETAFNLLSKSTVKAIKSHYRKALIATYRQVYRDYKRVLVYITDKYRNDFEEDFKIVSAYNKIACRYAVTKHKKIEYAINPMDFTLTVKPYLKELVDRGVY